MHTTIYSISESPRNGQRHLGRHRRRQPAGHARRRQDLDQRRRQRARPAQGILGLLGRSQPLRRRHGLRRLRPPHLRRHEPVRLQDHRLRQDLDAASSAPAAACAATRTSLRRTPVAPNLLFLGTEFGLWISLDGGSALGAVQGRRLPRRRRARHRRPAPRRDLVLATHGRGIWIVDDIHALRQLTSDDLSKRGGVPASAADPAAAARERRLVGRRRTYSRAPILPMRRRHHLLPAEAPHLRPHETRGLRRSGQAGRYRCPPTTGAASTAWNGPCGCKPPRVPPAATGRV